MLYMYLVFILSLIMDVPNKALIAITIFGVVDIVVNAVVKQIQSQIMRDVTKNLYK